MTIKDKLLHIAAQISQLKRELEAIGKDQTISLGASHECGVIQWYFVTVVDKLTKLSGKV